MDKTEFVNRGKTVANAGDKVMDKIWKKIAYATLVFPLIGVILLCIQLFYVSK